MEGIILNILAALRAGEAVDERTLVRLIHAQARRERTSKSSLAKRRLLPFYQRVKREEPERWRAWGVTPELERRLVAALRMKPRRTASGVATITVITKPWPCSGDCLFCPSDIRCPKSYLHGEPACERAEQNFFDPYLQASARLTALAQMGHATDKIELIVLGGTWSDYPEGYQIWFISELFRALNEGAAYPAPGVEASAGVRERLELYRAEGFPAGEEALSARAAAVQARINAGELSYNRAFSEAYGEGSPWGAVARRQAAAWDELECRQRENEEARHRVVGLVIETRPDAVTPAALTRIRRLGATKVQMGVQSLDQAILDANDRGIRVERIAEAFELLRAFGFKIHAHMMANLLGATPTRDKADYRRLMEGAAFQPDEVKLYPCALIEGARLCECYADGSWQPYTEDELLDVLADDVLATPPFCRISRMIRDFSSNDILVGNKKPNLRQLVEGRLREAGDARAVDEIRFREVGTGEVDVDGLRLNVVAYATTNTDERFLQWVAPDGRIAGFLRLSLPRAAYVRTRSPELPVREDEAMIREVHVYGAVARLGEESGAAQHAGLGRSLVERACELARQAGYQRVNVISAVGTRAYYRALGFCDNGLYQQRELA